jgi:hypothetical protein
VQFVALDVEMTRAALTLACVLAALLFFRAPSKRQQSIAEGLAALLAIDCWRPFLRPCVALDMAGFVAWFAVSTWVVTRVLDPSGPRTGQAFALLVCSSGVALQFEVTGELARATFALALAAQLLAAGRFAASGKKPDDAQRVALVLAASSLADALGPWLLGDPSRDWPIGRAVSVATWLLVALDQARALVRGKVARG